MSKEDSEGFSEFIYQGPDMLKLLLERDEQGETQVDGQGQVEYAFEYQYDKAHARTLKVDGETLCALDRRAKRTCVIEKRH